MGVGCSVSCCRTSETAETPKRKYTWRRDATDHRDHRVVFTERHCANPLPPKVDLRCVEDFPIFNQGFIGSCTAQAVASAFHFGMVRQCVSQFTPSRLFIYYNERAMDGNVNHDCGSTLRTGIMTVMKIGVCNEDLWPYHEWRFMHRPPDECYAQAAHHRAVQYARVDQTLDDLRRCLAAGIPVVFGFTVFSSFELGLCAITGNMSMPGCLDVELGGHAVMACGYDDEREVFIVRNSWSHFWGDRGYFYMPYAFILRRSYCDDFWAIRWVHDDDFPADRPPAPKPQPSGCCARSMYGL